MRFGSMLDSSAMRLRSSAMSKARKPHPIVQVVQNAAGELNDLLNAVGLRIALLRHQLEASAFEAEMVRLAGLIEKASQRVRRLEDYTRAEELVALMRPGRARKRSQTAGANGSPLLSEQRPRTALLITDASVDDSPIKECLERSGCKVVVAESSADGLRLLQSNAIFDHIVCDSTFLAETGWKFTAELSRAAPAARIYVLQRPRALDRVANPAE
jgi:PleD family two-component response regulator